MTHAGRSRPTNLRIGARRLAWRLVLVASGAFVLFYVFIGAPIAQMAEAAAAVYF